MKKKSTIYDGALRNITRATLCLLAFIFMGQDASSQCFQHITKGNSEIGVFNASTTCVLGNLLCLSSTERAELELAVDADLSTYAEWSNLVSVLGGFQGMSFKAKPGNNFNHKTATIFLSTGGGIIDLNVLNGLSISLFKNSVLVETRLFGNLIASTSVLSTETSVLSYFPDSHEKEYDEIRVFKSSGLISVLDNIRIHGIVLIDTNCISDNNNICRDFIQGSNTLVTSSSNLLNVLGGVSDIQNINDGNSNNYGTLSFAVDALTPYSIGVSDINNIYNSSGTTRAGVVIEATNSGILNLNVLNNYSMRLVTYLHGERQDSSHIFGQGSGPTLLALSALASTTGNESNKQVLSFTTSHPFNEVRLQFIPAVSVTLAPPIRIYGFFEEPTTCGDCIAKIKTSAAAPSEPISGSIRTGSQWTSGPPIVTAGVVGVANILDNNEDNYATIGGLLNALALRVTVELDSTLASGTFTGYEISNGGTLINLSLIQNFSIKTYLNNTLQETYASAELASLGLLGLSGTSSIIGFSTNKPFNAVMIETSSLLTLFPDLRIHNLVLVTDEDKDGTPDCIDSYPGCDNNYDANNNGVPDACEVLDLDKKVELISPVTSFRGGDTLMYKVTISNVGTSAAENTTMSYNAPAASQTIDWIRVMYQGSTPIDTFYGGDAPAEDLIPYLNTGQSAAYYVTVVMDENTNIPEVTSSIMTTSPHADATPECPECITPPLPRGNFPEVGLNITVLSTKLFTGNDVEFDLLVSSQTDAPTEGDIHIIVPKEPNYFSLAINTARTAAINNPSLLTDAANWTLDSSNPFYYVIKSNTNYSINGNTEVIIPLTFTKQGSLSNYELKYVPFTITQQYAGGDKTPINNKTDIYILFNIN